MTAFLVILEFLLIITIGDFMKIKVILTGGTVGSEKVNGVVKNNKDSNIASMWKEKFNSNIDFDVVNLYSILSENIKIKNIEMLLQN